MSEREYRQAMQTVVAGLKLLREHAKRAGLPVTTVDMIYHAEKRIADEMPPWDSEPAPETPRPWSEVSPGDEVQAPNGQWYRVDVWARIGKQMKIILIAPDGGKVQSSPPADAQVPTRRGATGQAADLFRAAGLDVEQIKVEVTA